MVLYCYLSLKSFVEMWGEGSVPAASFTLPAIELMHAVGQEEADYGLSLLREAIGRYEERCGIPEARSKRSMPFFRQDSRVLVGPEMGLYTISLYERPDLPLGDAGPILALELDYEALGEYCLSENLFLNRCKYDKEPVVEAFAARMEREYDTFFFDGEHTGLTPASGLFSLLCQACGEVGHPLRADRREWRLACLACPDEARYRYTEGDLVPDLPLALPLGCLRRVSLRDKERHPLLHGTLIGFLRGKGLPAERLLDLS